MPLVVTYRPRETPTDRTFGIADVVLAPLAVGDYVLELTFEVNGQKETRRRTTSGSFP